MIPLKNPILAALLQFSSPCDVRYTPHSSKILRLPAYRQDISGFLTGIQVLRFLQRVPSLK